MTEDPINTIPNSRIMKSRHYLVFIVLGIFAIIGVIDIFCETTGSESPWDGNTKHGAIVAKDTAKPVVVTALPTPLPRPEVPQRIRGLYRGKLQIIEVDRCEYLVYTYSESGSILHKRDCNNPIHKNDTIRYEQ